MKHSLLAGITALFLATGMAHADPLPNIFLGRWCHNDNDFLYHTVKTNEEWKTCQDNDGQMEINRHGFERYEESCRFVSIKYTGEKMPMSTKPRKEDWVPVVRITARCYVEGINGKAQIILRYIKEGAMTIAPTRADDAKLKAYHQQKKEYEQCVKAESENSKRCTELSDFDWDQSELQPTLKPTASPPEYKACHAGNRAACKRLRVRACHNGNPAACDYDEAQKQNDPMEWCGQRYGAIPSQYRFCLNGSPDR